MTNGEHIPQRHQTKLDAPADDWLALLLEGAVAEQVRLEALIRKHREWLRRLELAAALLSIMSATTLFAAMVEAFGIPKTASILAAGLLNFATLAVTSIKTFVEDKGKMAAYHKLYDQFGDFLIKITNPVSKRNTRAVSEAYQQLKLSIMRTAPEIRSEKPWDKMSDEEREMYLQMRVAQ